MPGTELTDRAAIAEVLRTARTVAVLGAHPARWKPSFYVPEHMHQVGSRILPVNPTKVGQRLWAEEVRGSLAELTDAVAPDGIDVLDVFRRSEDLPGHLEEILAMPVRPRTVWLQLGIRDDAFAAALLEAGMDVIQDRCMLADHKAWGLGPVA